MSDPWPTVWGVTVGVGGGLGGGWQRGKKSQENCNSIISKIYFLIKQNRKLKLSSILC